MLYEGMLLFGVVFISGWLFSTLIQQRHALVHRNALQIWLLFIVGLYFVWFWTHGGQTLAMKTWRIKLVRKDGSAMKIGHAILRYFLTWLWFAPGLALAWLVDAKNWFLILMPIINLVIWALAVYLDPERQFLHDRLAGTRLIKFDVKDAVKK
jgi:uncharacterized RDD family membrane protein YckC